MLTPYDFGREIGQLQAQIHQTMDARRIDHLAEILGIEERLEFMEGYSNSFVAYRKEEETEQNFDLSGQYCDNCGEPLEEGHECEEPQEPPRGYYTHFYG
jgi:hypothetical protein